MRIRKAITIIVFTSLLTSCDFFEPPPAADFEITNVLKGMKSYGSPFLTLTVKNVGNGTGYNVSCDVYAKIGNTIVDDGFAYFAGGGNIDPGESAIDEAIFFDLESHSDYTSLEYNLDWIDRDY